MYKFIVISHRHQSTGPTTSHLPIEMRSCMVLSVFLFNCDQFIGEWLWAGHTLVMLKLWGVHDVIRLNPRQLVQFCLGFSKVLDFMP